MKARYLIPTGGAVLLILLLILIGEPWTRALITGAIFAAVWVPLYPWFMKLVNWAVTKAADRFTHKSE